MAKAHGVEQPHPLPRLRAPGVTARRGVPLLRASSAGSGSSRRSVPANDEPGHSGGFLDSRLLRARPPRRWGARVLPRLLQPTSLAAGARREQHTPLPVVGTQQAADSNASDGLLRKETAERGSTLAPLRSQRSHDVAPTTCASVSASHLSRHTYAGVCPHSRVLTRVSLARPCPDYARVASPILRASPCAMTAG